MFLHDIPVVNYADEKVPFCTDLNISNVLIKLENAAGTYLQWFKENTMKANPDKYYLYVNTNKDSFQIKIGNETIPKANVNYLGLIGHESKLIEHFNIAM